MKAQIYLADFAQGSPGQKVHSIGLGWTQVSTPLPSHSVLILLDVPPEELGESVKISAWLADEKGNQQCDQQGAAIELQAEISTQQAENAAGVSTVAPIAVNLGSGLPLEPGEYRWKVELRGQDEVAERAFRVRESETGLHGTAP